MTDPQSAPETPSPAAPEHESIPERLAEDVRRAGAEVQTWAERKGRASAKARTARANTNALDYLSTHEDAKGHCQILVTACAVSRMVGSKFDFDEKATIVLAPAAPGETPEALDLYGAAGVTAVRGLVEELGHGPWPEALPFSLESVETSRGDRAVIVPLF